MRVKDVMSTRVRSVRSDLSLKDAAAILAGNRISGVPVVDADDRVVGVLSEGDILFKERGPDEKRSLLERWLVLPMPEVVSKHDARTVGESMTAPAITIGPQRPLAEAANTMLEEGVKRLPVVDDQRKLVGIVTRADLVRAFVRSDAEIEQEIREDVLQRALWIDPGSMEVTVERGEVRLAGEVEAKSDAELIPRLVQRVPGVVSVLAKLRWPEEVADRNGDVLPWRSIR